MQVTDLAIKGLKLITLKAFHDERGFFVERYNEDTFRKHGLPTNFVQDNHSSSKAKVLRGLHFQFDRPQGKLVGVIRGHVWDVAVDLRHDSPTFGQHIGVELSSENFQVLWIPAGFAHGFCVLGGGEAEVFYKVDTVYNAKGEMGISWQDPHLKIKWPVDNPVVSAKDQSLPSFDTYRASALMKSKWW